jgi:cbb3-type cytochrome oxidase cytochrome c subunit
MNHGPLIFLGVLVTFLTSWWGLVFAPQVQIGAQQNASLVDGVYPRPRAGLAEQGHQVYVANGCVQCHSQQLRQEGYTFDVVLTAPGTNMEIVTRVLGRIAPGINAGAVAVAATDKTPQTLLTNVAQAVAEDAAARLKKAGATAKVDFIPVGVDIARGWGSRLTVASDYLYDSPVQVGHSRLGPDLANYGQRAPSTALILQHLYHPRTTMPGSIMPAHQFLFETKPVGKKPSPDALVLTGKFAPPAGHEVVPKPEALQLAAYLQSLRANTPLFEAPASPAPQP